MDNKYEPIRQAAITLGVSIVVAAAFIGWLVLPGTPRPQNYEAFVIWHTIRSFVSTQGKAISSPVTSAAACGSSAMARTSSQTPRLV